MMMTHHFHRGLRIQGIVQPKSLICFQNLEEKHALTDIFAILPIYTRLPLMSLGVWNVARAKLKIWILSSIMGIKKTCKSVSSLFFCKNVTCSYPTKSRPGIRKKKPPSYDDLTDVENILECQLVILQILDRIECIRISKQV